MRCLHMSVYRCIIVIMVFNLCIFPKLAFAHKDNSLPTIKVGLLTGGWGPFQRWDGHNASGFSVELITILAKNLDYRIEWKAYPDWNQLYMASCAGQVDILLDAFRADERECVTYSRPYYSSPTVVVVRHDAPFFRDVSGLSKSRMAIEAGFLTEKLVRAYYPDVLRLLFRDTDMALQAVLDKRADAYIGNLHVTNQFIAQHPELAVVAQAPLLMESLHLGISKHKSRLGVRFDTAIQALTVEERSALEQSWLSDGSLSFQGHSGFLLRPDEREWLSRLPPLRLGFIPGWVPFSYADHEGKLTGLIGDYLDVFKDKLGLAYQYRVDQSWPELLQALLHQDADIAVIPIRISQRVAGWQVSQPIASFPVVIAMSRGSSTFGGFAELAGKHLIVTDSLLITELKSRIPDIQTTVVSSPKEGLAMVASGKGDAYMGNLAVISRLINEHFDDSLHIVAPTPFRDELAVAVREAYAPLLPLINRVLASMSDKEKRQIRNSWLAVNYNEGISWHKLVSTLIPVGAGITLFILSLSIAYFHLRQEITRRRQVEADLALAKEAAELAARQKADFLATMSHEIRTPMNGILGMAEQLRFTSLDPEQRQMVGIINQGAEGLLQLIGNVLDYSKLDAGKMELAPTSFLLRELIDSVLTMTSSELQRKGLQLYLRVDDEVGARFYGDVLRLKQVLFNLASNAIKFTERGFIELSIRVEGETDEEQWLLLGVQDTGIGMSEDVQARVFNAFEQADGATTRSYGGTGLGLSISQTLATLMGGRLRLDSAPGLGTHIGLSIPLALEARYEPDPKLAGLNVFMALPDGKLHHTLRLHLLSLGLRLCEAPQGAHLLFGDLNEPAAIRVAPLGNVLGYQLRDDGHYCLNSNPLTWQAVRDVCYRQLGLAEQLSSDFSSVGSDEPLLRQRLLVVEDHHLNQVLVQRQLKQLNLQCDLAENGRQALAMLTFHRYDLILCDCQMPVMDGYEFTRRVRATEGLAQLPIIAMTANVLPEQAQRCLAAGMNDVLGKPVLMDGLRQMLTKWQILPVPRLLDINQLQAAFGSSLETMLVSFRQELEQSLGLSHEDDKALANWVHRQAGTIAMMRVDGVAEQAWHLEEQIRKDGRAGCEVELTKFRDVLQQLVDELAALSQDCRQPAVAI
ncbi:transporter substrate-binding domain-containing protein [Aeromonas hydrophila]|nr:transporter substrate-binding domain-containing protein [Aeromonas hydrophila]MBQ4713747.1 transporter substrate-binding domain-containing protein [Aeromonas hydrophila]MBW3822163.1 transporter substrate-binding domain-containing protein [Aeromonas hydrophila]MBW5269605.1 transporter substrate-binding domain-containing protein [Aeromonas hydrophila]QSR52899.1 transporter substrate-binding domain-containing protein [Aeromonas hydrophila]